MGEFGGKTRRAQTPGPATLSVWEIGPIVRLGHMESVRILMGRLTPYQRLDSLLGVLRTAKPLVRGGRNATGLTETAGLPNRASIQLAPSARPSVARQPGDLGGSQVWCGRFRRRLIGSISPAASQRRPSSTSSASRSSTPRPFVERTARGRGGGGLGALLRRLERRHHAVGVLTSRPVRDGRPCGRPPGTSTSRSALPVHRALLPPRAVRSVDLHCQATGGIDPPLTTVKLTPSGGPRQGRAVDEAPKSRALRFCSSR